MTAKGKPWKRGWTPARRKKFLAKLEETGGNVAAAARAVSLPRRQPYNIRRNDEEFARGWDDAVEAGTDDLEQEARRRALHGVREPVFYQGEVVGHIQKYSDGLMMFLLKANRPEKFGDKQELKVSGSMTIHQFLDDLPDPDDEKPDQP